MLFRISYYEEFEKRRGLNVFPIFFAHFGAIIVIIDLPESKGSVLYRLIHNLTIYVPDIVYILSVYHSSFKYYKKQTYLPAVSGFN